MSNVRISAYTRASTDGHRLHVNSYWEPNGAGIACMVAIRSGDIHLILPIEDAQILAQAILEAAESVAVGR